MGQRKAAASFWENGEERIGAACGQLYKRVIHIGGQMSGICSGSACSGISKNNGSLQNSDQM